MLTKEGHCYTRSHRQRPKSLQVCGICLGHHYRQYIRIHNIISEVPICALAVCLCSPRGHKSQTKSISKPCIVLPLLRWALKKQKPFSKCLFYTIRDTRLFLGGRRCLYTALCDVLANEHSPLRQNGARTRAAEGSEYAQVNTRRCT